MNKNIVPQSTYVAALCLLTLVAGCVAPPAPPPRYVVVRPAPVYMSPLPPAAVAYSSPVVTPVISVYIDPPMVQPEPIAVSWAPPAMLVEVPPLSPFPTAVWTGGYWDWHDRWVWSAGRWMAPPQFGYGWVQPYYEHRDNAVLFVSGYWSAPGLRFVPPPLGMSFAFAAIGVGVVAGLAPIGPQGVFVPPPPGSRPGLIVPAPIGTPPAVVTSAPPVTNVGMRIQNTTISNSGNVTNNVTNTTNITNVANTRNFMVTAPAAATASGKPFEAAVPAAAHLAAALPPVMRLEAPVPASAKPVAAFMAGRAPVALPAAQMVRSAPATTTAIGTPSAPSAASMQRPEPDRRQAAASPAASPETPRMSRVSDDRIEAAKQANVQQAAQQPPQQPAPSLSRPAPANKGALQPGAASHPQRPPERFAERAAPVNRQAARPSPGGHPGERPKPERRKE